MNDRTAIDEAQLDAVFFALASEPRRRILDILKAEPAANVNRVRPSFDRARSMTGSDIAAEITSYTPAT